MDTAGTEVQGVIEEALPNTLFRVNLDSGENILAYLAGKMRLQPHQSPRRGQGFGEARSVRRQRTHHAQTLRI